MLPPPPPRCCHHPCPAAISILLTRHRPLLVVAATAELSPLPCCRVVTAVELAPSSSRCPHCHPRHSTALSPLPHCCHHRLHVYCRCCCRRRCAIVLTTADVAAMLLPLPLPCCPLPLPNHHTACHRCAATTIPGPPVPPPPPPPPPRSPCCRYHRSAAGELLLPLLPLPPPCCHHASYRNAAADDTALPPRCQAGRCNRAAAGLLPSPRYCRHRAIAAALLLRCRCSLCAATTVAAPPQLVHCCLCFKKNCNGHIPFLCC